VTTLLVALDGLADVVHVERSGTRVVRCPGVDGPANLAWSALDALEREAGRPLPVEVVIEKAIPSQAGLGGGSSDAAATLVAVSRLHGLDLDDTTLERIARSIGADVPFFVRGGAQWGSGRGERLRPGSSPPFAAILMRPEAGLSTPDVYRAFDRLAAPAPVGDGAAEVPDGFAGLPGWVRNDLWPAALALRPGLGRSARALAAVGARPVLMSGSGSCLAGFFLDLDTAREAAGRLPAGPGLRAVVTPSSRGVRPVPEG